MLLETALKMLDPQDISFGIRLLLLLRGRHALLKTEYTHRQYASTP